MARLAWTDEATLEYLWGGTRWKLESRVLPKKGLDVNAVSVEQDRISD